MEFNSNSLQSQLQNQFNNVWTEESKEQAKAAAALLYKLAVLIAYTFAFLAAWTYTLGQQTYAQTAPLAKQVQSYAMTQYNAMFVINNNEQEEEEEVSVATETETIEVAAVHALPEASDCLETEEVAAATTEAVEDTCDQTQPVEQPTLIDGSEIDTALNLNVSESPVVGVAKQSNSRAAKRKTSSARTKVKV